MVNKNSRSIVLRCEARRKKNIWIATCLELGIVITSPTPDKLKQEMAEAVKLYFEGITEAIKDGYRPKLVPVQFYRMRQLWFDIRYMIRYVVKGRLSALIAKVCLRGPLETELWRKDTEYAWR